MMGLLMTFLFKRSPHPLIRNFAAPNFSVNYIKEYFSGREISNQKHCSQV